MNKMVTVKEKYEWLAKAKREYGIAFWQGALKVYPFINALPYKSLLDVGTGGGKYLDHLGSQYETIYGVDWAVEPRVKRENFHFFKTDAWEIPLPDKSVDITTSFDFIEHIEPDRLEDIFKEMCRVTKYMMIHKINSCNSSAKRDVLETQFGAGEGELHLSIHDNKWWNTFLKDYCQSTFLPICEFPCQRKQVFFGLVM